MTGAVAAGLMTAGLLPLPFTAGARAATAAAGVTITDSAEEDVRTEPGSQSEING
ncbi:hypothetical protein ACVV2G_18920 [Streptomyces ziwulingensis]